MALPAVAGNTMLASDFYVIGQPSGGTEAGKYYLGGWAGAGSDTISMYIRSSSQGSVPVSVSIDTADQAPSNMGSPSTGNLTKFGFQIFSTSSGAATNCHAAGNSTISY